MSGVGITFDETHSFRDWGLRLKKIAIGIPKAKTEYVSVPGMNGDLDLSEAQNGGVKYEMRTLKFTFGARNCSYERWSGLLSQIASDLQGISKRIILDTDKGYYYHSPSKVFADEIGKWIPPGIGVGIEAEMPDLYKQMDDEMASLGKRMQTAVNVETGKIAVDKKVSTTYKVEKEKQGVFESGDTTVEITGETHVHVDLDGREVGDTTTPIVDENMARIDTHKKRGG